VYALRFYAGGERQYVTLGTAEQGGNRRRAEDELAATMAAVRSGSWSPPEPVTAPQPAPAFHEFASEWYRAGEPGWAEETRTNYRWQLIHHLLPHFRDHLLRQITVAEVDHHSEKSSSERGGYRRDRSTRRSRASAKSSMSPMSAS
jgi:integrase-like protein